MARTVLQYRCRDVVGAGLLCSRPDSEEVENPACRFLVGIVRRTSFQKRKGARFLLRVTGLRRTYEVAAQDEDIWRRSNTADCGDFSEVG